MSDERLEELGLPRRAFLKKVVAGAFVAPVVVSFGLDGIAEAGPIPFPNQTIPNQFVQLIELIDQYEENGFIDPRGIATSLRQKVVQAAAAYGSGNNASLCGVLGAIQHELSAQDGQHVQHGADRSLSHFVSELQALLNCSGGA